MDRLQAWVLTRDRRGDASALLHEHGKHEVLREHLVLAYRRTYGGVDTISSCTTSEIQGRGCVVGHRCFERDREREEQQRRSEEK